MKDSVKKIILLITGLSAALCLFIGCEVATDNTNNTPAFTVDPATVTMTQNTGAIGSFALVSPVGDVEVMALPAFVWQEADKADTYQFELCSGESFSQSEEDVYVKKTGITDTSFTLSSVVKEKNAYYYWRVTAVNADTKKQSAVGRFYLKADEREIEFDVNYADEWTVHGQGSAANISVDDSDFFGNGKNSLVVEFEEEDVKRGIPLSDGWIVVTHSQETEMYGVDAFYFNFYYSGNDADIFLRVVDEDNEYWHAQIKLANNAKQTVIIKFEDFELRTKGGTTIANKVFDYNYIKYVELVFEKSFGDGVAMISDLKAVNYKNYGYLFIDGFDFTKVDESAYIYENYVFDTAVSEDGSAMTYSFSNAANDKNASGINGYGFVKLPIEKLLVNGDAFKFNLAYTGNIRAGNVLIRLIEEDGDRWVYRQKLSLLNESGDLVVPYMAFTLSEYHGDGSRQFYYIKQLQLGIESVYSTGSITVSDFFVTYLEDEIEGLYISEVDDNGVIDDFNAYSDNVELYYKWMLSDTNKDELMAVEKGLAFGSGNVCAKLGYKADMGQAMYGTMFAAPDKEYNALSIWAMDRSIKHDDAAFNYIDEVNAQMIISLYVSTGEEYYVVVDAVSKYWTEYVFTFENFTLQTGYFGDVTPLESQNIVGIKVGFQYYYYAMSGGKKVPNPTYVSGNAVYVDNIAFTSADESGTRELTHKLMPSAEDPNVCVIDDFDGDTEATLDFKGERGYDYEKLSLSSVTASGEGQSLEMKYKGNGESVAYAVNTVFDASVSANCVKILLKGDGKATVYINIYLDYAGTTYKFRATLTEVDAGWKVYTIGYDKFEKIEGTGNVALTRSRTQYITKITFGIVNYKDYEESSILLDKIVLDGTVPDRQGGTTQFKREDYEGQL